MTEEEIKTTKKKSGMAEYIGQTPATPDATDDGAEAAGIDTIKKAPKLTRKQKSKQRRNVLTAAMIMLLVGALAVGGFSIYALKYVSTVRVPALYRESGLGYGASAVSALETAPGFTENLCVGPDNQAYGDVHIESGACGALFSLTDKKVLFAQNMYDTIYPASITKLMTLVVALKYGNMDDMVTIAPQDINLEEGSQSIGFAVGDTVRLKELINAMVVYSGNDAAMAVARHVGGAVSDFVNLMNEEALKIGAVGTHFVNPTGLHDYNHYTCVYDIYLMLNAASAYPEFFNMSQNPYYVLTYTNTAGEEIQKRLDSTDYYLTGYRTVPKNVSVLGGKTGTTSIAGSCLALVTQNAYGELFIDVIVREQNKKMLYDDMDSLLISTNM
ncbi:MAG: serine hydrolase [Lachnospiraceae bacterium]|nr:serine hydrolase [Lachnospiraceae bacterium]